MTFNKKNLITALNRSAATYDKASIVQKEIALRLLEHLNLMHINPEIILDLGAKTGFTTKFLKKRFSKSYILALDITEKMLQKTKQGGGWFYSQPSIVAEFELLPFQDNSVDFIFSNFALAFCSDLLKTLREIRRILKTNGLFLFSTYGPDTLKEIRESWLQIDNKVHVYDFIDIHHIGDVLLQMKFTDPVMEMEHLTMSYRQPQILFDDLKKTASNNLSSLQTKNLTGKKKFQNFLAAYEKFRQPNGTLPATFEIIYGHARKTSDQHSTEVSIPIEQILNKNKISR